MTENKFVKIFYWTKNRQFVGCGCYPKLGNKLKLTEPTCACINATWENCGQCNISSLQGLSDYFLLLAAAGLVFWFMDYILPYPHQLVVN